MDNGIYYNRMELKISLYEAEKTGNAVAIIVNADHPGEPIILNGEKACKFAEAIGSIIEEVTNGES